MKESQTPMAEVVYRKHLKSVFIAGGEIRRSLVTIGTEPVVLFHKNHPILQPKFTARQWREFTSRMDATKFAHELSIWNSNCPNSFNCHSLAIAGGLGIKPDSWLEGAAAVFTLGENPAQVLLDAFYDRIATCDASQTAGCLSVTLNAIEGEMLVFADSSTGDLVHSARIVFDDGCQPLLFSKLGEYPATVSTFEDIAIEYNGQFDLVHRYRISQNRLDPKASSRPTTQVQDMS